MLRGLWLSSENANNLRTTTPLRRRSPIPLSLQHSPGCRRRRPVPAERAAGTPPCHRRRRSDCGRPRTPGPWRDPSAGAPSPRTCRPSGSARGRKCGAAAEERRPASPGTTPETETAATRKCGRIVTRCVLLYTFFRPILDKLHVNR